MKVDLIGRVKNTSLPASKALLPLFEAVVNSLEAIEDRKTGVGKIDVRLHREETVPSKDEEVKGLITGFTIIDNGIGFDKQNYEAFATSDTTYKSDRGAKGIGRLHWLKAFDQVLIESVFEENGASFRRRFRFMLTPEGIADHELNSLTEPEQPLTKVRLVGYKNDYKERCPQEAESIARRIIEHCLVFFMDEKCPEISLHDCAETIGLNDLYREDIKKEARTDKLCIRGNDFCIRYYKLYESGENEHRLHYCANQREVSDEKIARYVPDLKPRLHDAKVNKDFVLSAYLSGEYLDAKVTPDRTGFGLAEAGSMFPDEIGMDELRKAVMQKIRVHLEPYIAPLREAKIERIKEYVQQKRPRYRAAVKHGREYLDDIPPGLSDEKLDLELAKLEFQVTQRLHEERDGFLKADVEKIENSEAYRAKLTEFIDRYDDFGKSQLAEYVAHRRVILDLLESALRQKEDGKYSREEYVHDLICPRRTTSDDLPVDSMNLWVIDERLSYHKHLASDQSLSQIEEGQYAGRERPDLAIFNVPIAFSEEEYPYSSVVIVEFKRPARDDYTEETNPIKQVLGYIEKFRAGKAKDKYGKPIPEDRNRRFFCYIICDRTPNLVELAEREDFSSTPDGQGFFRYHERYSAYIEIIPFGKLLQDAEKRNRVLFEKLCLD